MIVGAVLITLIISALIMIIIGGRNIGRRRPPGPRGLPVVGNLLQFDTSKPLVYMQKLSQIYGPLVYLKHGSTPTLVVSSAKIAKQILKAQDLSFCSRPPVVGQQKLSYDGVDMAFSPHNDHWKEVRKLCMLHLFSPKQVRTFRPTREQQVGRMVEKIVDKCGGVVNLSDMAMSLASNTICGVAFGRTYDDDEYEKRRLDLLLLEAQALMVSFYFSDHFKPAALGWVVDKASGLLGRLDRNFEEMDGLYQQLIDEHLAKKMKIHDFSDDDDMIDLLIKLKRQRPDNDVTWDHIKALLMNLFVAGTDTVAAVVVWTMTALMLRPEIMKKTQAHIREVMLKEKKQQQQQHMMIVEDDIHNLTYLKAVVMESLRLYPPAPLLYRRPDRAVEVEGYEIEAGSTLIINGWAIARDPEMWEEPEEFVPERFMRSDRELEFDEFSMLPFGGGRRGCPGMTMGMASIHLALANLLYSFDWALPAPPSNDVEDDICSVIDTHALPGLTMHKKNPLLLVPTIPIM